MRKHLILVSFLGALLAAPTLYAQTPPAGTEDRPHAMRGRDCSKASDPMACEERQSKMREAFKKSEASCKGKEGPDRRTCMREQMCAQAKDPGKCRERVEKHGEHHAKGAEHRKDMMKACEGKKDDELRKCVRDERAKRRDEKK